MWRSPSCSQKRRAPRSRPGSRGRAACPLAHEQVLEEQPAAPLPGREVAEEQSWLRLAVCRCLAGAVRLAPKIWAELRYGAGPGGVGRVERVRPVRAWSAAAT